MASLFDLLKGMLASKEEKPFYSEGADPTEEEMMAGRYLGADPVDKKRLTLLPRYTEKEGWIAPNVVNDMLQGVSAPYKAWQGRADVGDALNMMQNFAYGSMLPSKATPGTVRTLLGEKELSYIKTKPEVQTALAALKNAEKKGIQPGSPLGGTAWVGPDGKGRFWVSDHGLKIDEAAWQGMSDKVPAKLGYIIKHPELEKYAPQLLDQVRIKKMSVKDHMRAMGKSLERMEPDEALEVLKESKKRTGGFYDQDAKILYVNTERPVADQIRTALHELGHNTQAENNMLFGANASETVRQVRTMKTLVEQNPELRPDWDKFLISTADRIFTGKDPRYKAKWLAGMKGSDAEAFENAAFKFYSQLHGEKEANIPGFQLGRPNPPVNPGLDYADIMHNSLRGDELDVMQEIFFNTLLGK
jgi:hypothetical protein